ncbi:uncharacterized protein LOC130494646 [Raphanus sativus]|uniref:Uncharacterized protein LOC130494646 n=1 Tax=Raphanus sativus TaxID=3726 RepID=A0A9W3BVC1_RAPSA|nr:uncharacterized protein LOC130494646 [Raphanus sativus]
MRFVKIRVWQDERSVSNVYNVSSIAINPDMKDVEYFMALFSNVNMSTAFVEPKPLSMVSTISDEDDFFVVTPQKTISEILDSRKVERCFLICTVAAIDIDMGWFYMTCKVCGNKVETRPNHCHGERTTAVDNRWLSYCTTCKILSPKLLPKYKLHLVVLDNTGHSKLLLLDDVVLQLLHQPCYYGNTDGIVGVQYQNVLRTALANIVGKTFTFKIIVDKENYMYKDDTFKVVNIITSPYMINGFHVSVYPKGSCHTFSPLLYDDNEVSELSTLILGNTRESSTSTGLTPAKRKRLTTENLEEQNSNSEALGLRPNSRIKIEKKVKVAETYLHGDI